eukprot:CAMPEP_0173147698 /NCGR_PEP_ID=MMETSP1105-20130129/9285_1 /TAXON_ID=2985 /ORGANISM="Ochromonas sp., Strain BG-1" /LENGTH=46 /DNA_ID= /DNA_START= /DNA_END= /DNA_ORIENTATION=
MSHELRTLDQTLCYLKYSHHAPTATASTASQYGASLVYEDAELNDC